jgi:hypothetical protein
MQYKLCFYKLLLVLKWCYYFCLFWYFIVHTIIPWHSYKHSSIAIRRGFSPSSHRWSAQWEKPWGAEPRFELGPSLQQKQRDLLSNRLHSFYDRLEEEHSCASFYKKVSFSRTLSQLSKGDRHTGFEATPILLLCNDLICCTFSRFPLLNFQPLQPLLWMQLAALSVGHCCWIYIRYNRCFAATWTTALSATPHRLISCRVSRCISSDSTPMHFQQIQTAASAATLSRWLFSHSSEPSQS